MSLQSDADRLVIYPSRTKMVLLFLAAIAFVAGGVWIGSPAMAGQVSAVRRAIAVYAGIPFFGLGGAFILYRLVKWRPSFIADASGFTDSASVAGIGHIPWSDVDHIKSYEIRGQPLLGVWPKDVQALLERQGSMRRRLMQANISMGSAPIAIPQATLPMKVEELASLLEERFGVRVEREP